MKYNVLCLVLFRLLYLISFSTYETSAVDAEFFVRIFRIDGATRAVQHFTERVNQSVGFVACPTTQFTLIRSYYFQIDWNLNLLVAAAGEPLLYIPTHLIWSPSSDVMAPNGPIIIQRTLK